MAKFIVVGVVLCCYFVSKTMANCGQLLDNTVSPADKANIVDTHNYLRSLISQGRVPGQPRGKNIKKMKWDEGLAREAQKIAKTCEFRHQTVNDKRFYVGQNLGWSASTDKTKGTDWKGIVQNWFNENKNFRYPNKSRGVTGHYTQVVWADSYLIGCGYSSYHKDSSDWYEKLYVCNYGPGGNYIGEPPYKT